MSICTKIQELWKTVATYTHDIIVFTDETNLSPDVSSSELGWTVKNIFCKDRSAYSSIKSSGGRLMIALNSSFKAHVVEHSVKDVECLFVSGLFVSSVLIVGLYIPPH